MHRHSDYDSIERYPRASRKHRAWRKQAVSHVVDRYAVLRQWLIWLGIAAVLAGLLTVGLCVSPMAFAQDQGVMVADISGQVDVRHASEGVWEPLSVGRVLEPQDQVRASNGDAAEVRWANGAVSALEHGQVVTVHDVLQQLRTPVQAAGTQGVALVELSGKVQWHRAGETTWATAEQDMELFNGDQVRTFLGSHATLLYPDETRLTLAESSVLEIMDTSKNPRTQVEQRELKLHLGRMKYEVTPLEEKGSEFTIYSSTAIVGITGTKGVIVAEGENQPTYNILTEGSTFNQTAQDSSGRPLEPGSTIMIDGNNVRKYQSTASEQVSLVITDDEAALDDRFAALLKEVQDKRLAGYHVSRLQLRVERIERWRAARRTDRVEAELETAEAALQDLGTADPRRAELARGIEEVERRLVELQVGISAAESARISRMLLQAWSAWNERRDVSVEAKVQEITLALDVAEASAIEGADTVQMTLSKSIDSVFQELVLKQGKGFLVTEARLALGRAEFAVKRDQLAEAWRHVDEARRLLALARRQQPVQLKQEIARREEQVQSWHDEGFNVTKLEELLRTAKLAYEEDYYQYAAEAVQKLDATAQQLGQQVPGQLLYRWRSLTAVINRRASQGYTVVEPERLAQEAQAHMDSGAFVEAEAAVLQAETQLQELTTPQAFLDRLGRLQEDVATARAQGLPTEELKRLQKHIRSALDAHKLSVARRSLNQAFSQLQSLRDNIPPTLQVADLEYGVSEVLVQGLVTDNAGVDYVVVHGNRADVDDEGRFQQQLVHDAQLTEVKVQAVDHAGNTSPWVAVPVETTALATPPTTVVELADVAVQLDGDHLNVSGRATPGARVTVDDHELVVPTSGHWAAALAASAERLSEGLSVQAMGIDGSSSQEHVVVTDAQGPTIRVQTVSVADRVPPAVQLNPLTYAEEAVVIQGHAADQSTIVIAGTVMDVSGVSTFMINDVSVPLSDDGQFEIELPVTEDLMVHQQLRVAATDALNNARHVDVPLNLGRHDASLFINDRAVVPGADGTFRHELPLADDLTRITVTARDLVGNTTRPQTLLLADRMAPTLKLGDPIFSSRAATITGVTEANARVHVGTESVEADAMGVFSATLALLAEPQSLEMYAEDMSGNQSELTSMALPPISDQQAPQLTLSELDYQNGSVIVRGRATDDDAIAEVRINEELVELDRAGFFEHVLNLSLDLTTVQAKASDTSGKVTQDSLTVVDEEAPRLTVQPLDYEQGQVVVRGRVTDNIGLKQLTVNNVPVTVGTAGAFEYRLMLTAALNTVQVEAVDYMGQVTAADVLEVSPPPDSSSPVLQAKSLQFGSPQIIVSGLISDDIGIRAVTINGTPVTVYENGSYELVVPLSVGSPVFDLNDLQYGEGVVEISGSVSLGAISPSMIVILGTDLQGNEAPPIRRPIDTSSLGDMHLKINDQAVTVNDGRFEHEVVVNDDLRGLELMATDPFGEVAEPMFVPLESTAPSLSVNALEYLDGNLVRVSGLAQDDGSGVQHVLVNNTEVAVSGSTFSYALSDAVASVEVIAVDRLGNRSRAEILSVEPPDRGAPYYVVNVSPTPAFTGQPLQVDVVAYDESNQDQLDPLLGAPQVTVKFSDGSTGNITMSGAQAEWSGSINLAGDAPVGLARVTVSGTDLSGNSGSRAEGTTSVLINAVDQVPPTFTVAIEPQSPITSGTTMNILVTASESLQLVPSAQVALPDGSLQTLTLDGAAETLQFSALLELSRTLRPGLGVVTVEGAVDLAGNAQSEVAEALFDLAAPQAAAQLPLVIDGYELLFDQFRLRATTGAGAMVHIELGSLVIDLPADPNGVAHVERSISSDELDQLGPAGAAVMLTAQASTYAGLESELRNIMVTVPERPASTVAGPVLVDINPPTEATQGDTVSVTLDLGVTPSEPPRALWRWADGRTEALALSGSGANYSGSYRIAQHMMPGPASLEIRVDDQIQNEPYNVLPSMRLMAKMSRGGPLFNVSATPDPALRGEPAEIRVSSMVPLERIPDVVVRHAGGVSEIIMGGSGKEFVGLFTADESVPVGSARIVVDPDLPTRFERPFGIKDPARYAVASIRLYAIASPDPLLPGEAAEIMVFADSALGYVPQATLQLSDGRQLPVTLTGSAQGQEFRGSITLPDDASMGPAHIDVLDETGQFVGEGWTAVAPPRLGDGAVMVRAYPEVLFPGQHASIEVSSLLRPLRFMPNVRLLFADGRPLAVNVYGPRPGMHFMGDFMVPFDAAPGPVSISVTDPQGTHLGDAQAVVEEEPDERRRWTMLIDPPAAQPGDTVEFTAQADGSISAAPHVEVHFMDGRYEHVFLTGALPGDRFTARLVLQPDAMIAGAMVDLYDATGEWMLGEPLNPTATAPVMGGPGMGMPMPMDSGIEISPNPPVLGSDLQITLNAPFPMPFMPRLLLYFEDGSQIELPVSGSIGDTTATASFPGSDFTSPLHEIVLESPDGIFLTSRSIAMEAFATMEAFNAWTEPAAPGEIVVAWDPYPAASTFELSWRSPVTGESRLTVASTDRYLLRDMMPGVDYSFTVRALDQNGSELALTPEVYGMTAGGSAGMMAATLNVNPYDPRPGDVLNIEAFLPISLPPGMAPQAVIHYRNGGRENVLMGGYGMQFNGYSRPAQYFVDRVELVDPYSQTVITSLNFGHVAMGYQGPPGDIVVAPDPPLPGQSLFISANFPEPLYEIPDFVVMLQNGVEFIVQAEGATGGHSFSAELSGAQMIDYPNLIEAEVSDGQIIAQRLFVSGGAAEAWIDVLPDPPIVGRAATIGINFPTPVTFTPQVELEFTDGRRLSLPAVGSIPGTDFTVTLTVADMVSPLELVDVYGPDGMVGSRAGLAAGAAGYYGTAVNAWMDVLPDPPQVNFPLEVVVHFDGNVDYNPTVALQLQNGNRIDKPATGPIPSNEFHAYFSPDELSAPVTVIDVMDQHYTWLTSREFGGYSGGGGYYGPDGTIVVTPNPPVLGQAVDIQAQFPESVWEVPEFEIQLADGTSSLLATTGQPGDTIFSAQLPAALHFSPLNLVEVFADGRIIASDVFVAEGAASATISVTPDPPQAYQAMTVYVEFDQPVAYRPGVSVEMINGAALDRFADGTLPGELFVLNLTAAELSAPLELIDVFDQSGAIVGTRDFEAVGGPGGYTDNSSVNLSPNPPIVGQPLNIDVHAPEPVPAAPLARIHYHTGGIEDVQLLGAPFSQDFYGSVGYISGPVEKIEMLDPVTYGVYHTEYINDAGSGIQSGSTVQLVPDPPIPGTPLAIDIYTPYPVSTPPIARIHYTNGSSEDLYLGGAPYTTQFYGDLTATQFYIDRVEVLDPFTFQVQDTYYVGGGYAGGFYVNLYQEGSNEAKVEWQPIAGVDHYLVHFGEGTPDSGASDQGISPIRANAFDAQLLLTGLTSGIELHVRVEARLVDGTIVDEDQRLVQMSGGILPVPTGVSVFSPFPDALDVFWNQVFDPSVVGYRIYYGEQSGNYGFLTGGSEPSPIEIYSRFETARTIFNLDSGKQYFFAVSSVASDGSESPLSEEQTAIPISGGGSDPGGPGGALEITGEVFLGVVAPGESASVPVIVENSSTGSFERVLAVITFPLENEDGSGTVIPNQNVSLTPDAFTVPVFIPAGAGGNATLTVQVPAGTPTGSYEGFFKVFNDTIPDGFHDPGANEPFAESSFDVIVGSLSGTVTTLPVLPAVNQPFQINFVSDVPLTLPPIAHVELINGLVEDVPLASVDNINWSASRTLPAPVDFIEVTNSTGTFLSFIEFDLPVVSGVTAINGAFPGDVLVSWDPVPGVDSYVIRARQFNQAYGIIAPEFAIPAETSKTVVNLAGGVQHFFTVQAALGFGFPPEDIGPSSLEASATPISGSGSGGAITAIFVNQGGGETSTFSIGDSIGVEVDDTGLNLDPFVNEFTQVTVTASNGDSETIFLYEFGINSSVFSGSISSQFSGVSPGNFILEGGPSVSMNLQYTGSDSSGPYSANATFTGGDVNIEFADNAGSPRTQYVASDKIYVTVESNFVQPPLFVNVQNLSNFDQETLQLFETSPSSGFWLNTTGVQIIVNSPITSQDGVMSAALGHALQVTFNDGVTEFQAQATIVGGFGGGEGGSVNFTPSEPVVNSPLSVNFTANFAPALPPYARVEYVDGDFFDTQMTTFDGINWSASPAPSKVVDKVEILDNLLTTQLAFQQADLPQVTGVNVNPTAVSGELNVTWDALPGAQNYIVDVLDLSTPSATEFGVNVGGATSHLLTALPPTNHRVQVKLAIGSGLPPDREGPRSSEVNAIADGTGGGGGGGLLLDVLETTLNLGTTAPNTISQSVNFTIQNNDGVPFNNIKRELGAANNLFLDGGGGHIGAGRIDVTASPVGAGLSGSFSISVDVPSKPEGTYSGTLTIYDDTNFNGSLDGSEPFESVPMTFTVSSAPPISVTFVNAGGGAVPDYAPGDQVYIEVVDHGANTDDATSQFINVNLNIPGGDNETVQLQDFAANPGLFIVVGGIPSQDNPTPFSDGIIQATDQSVLNVDYFGSDSQNHNANITFKAPAPVTELALTDQSFNPRSEFVSPEFVGVSLDAPTGGGSLFVDVRVVETGDDESYSLIETFTGSGVWQPSGGLHRVIVGHPLVDFDGVLAGQVGHTIEVSYDDGTTTYTETATINDALAGGEGGTVDFDLDPPTVSSSLNVTFTANAPQALPPKVVLEYVDLTSEIAVFMTQGATDQDWSAIVIPQKVVNKVEVFDNADNFLAFAQAELPLVTGLQANPTTTVGELSVSWDALPGPASYTYILDVKPASSSEFGVDATGTTSTVLGVAPSPLVNEPHDVQVKVGVGSFPPERDGPRSAKINVIPDGSGGALIIDADLTDVGGIPVSSYNLNDTVYIEIDDAGADFSGTFDQVSVTLSVAAGDSETFNISETGPTTGLFFGSIGSSESGAFAVNNGLLEILAGQTVTLNYTASDSSGPHQATATFQAPLSITVNLTDGLGGPVVSTFNEGDTVGVQIDDAGRDLSPTVQDSFSVTLSTAAGGTDIENNVVLTETGTATGLFQGSITSTTAATAINNGMLEALSGHTVNLNYTASDSSGPYNASATFQTAASITVDFVDVAGGSPVATYTIGNSVFLDITDSGWNLSPTLTESILVTVTTSRGDIESLTLWESGTDSSLFSGTMTSSQSGAPITNSSLEALSGDTVDVSYMASDSSGPHLASASLQDALTVTVDLTDGLGGPVVSTFNEGDTVGVQIDDAGRDLSPTVQDSFSVTLSTAAGGTDIENNVVLTETGTATGLFQGSITSTTAATAINNGMLEALSGHTVNLNYTASDSSGPYNASATFQAAGPLPAPLNVDVTDTGSGGALVVTWDAVAGADDYEVLYDTDAPGAPYASSQFPGNVTLFTLNGLTNGVQHHVAVRARKASNPGLISVDVTGTPTSAGPTFAGLVMARSTATAQQVELVWDAATSSETTIHYEILYAISPSQPVFQFTVTNMTSTFVNALTAGQEYDFIVRAREDISGIVENNTQIRSATPTGSTALDHIDIVVPASGTVNQPVLVELQAIDTGSLIDVTYDGSVEVKVDEIGGARDGTALVSVQDRVTGQSYNVEMFQGLGFFTVDTQEPEDLQISVEGITSTPVTITFNAAPGSALTQFVVNVKDYGLSSNIPVLVSAVDASGRLDTAYTGTIDLLINSGNPAGVVWSVLEGSGTLVTANRYLFGASDDGEVLLELDLSGSGLTGPQTVTVEDTVLVIGSNTDTVTPATLAKYVLENRGRRDLAENVTTGGRIKFFAYATDSSDNILSGYNGAATVNIISESSGGPGDSARVSPASLQFVDGVAEFEVEDSEFETVQIQVVGSGPDAGINSMTVIVVFQSTDTTPPQVLKARAESPYEVRVWFSEEIDSSSILMLSNFPVDGIEPHTTCWYGDQMTLHLLLPIPQGAQLVVEGTSGDDVKDTNGNYIGSNPTVTIEEIPTVDYLGAPLDSGDFFEVQVSNRHVIVYHKNACGYLSGTNAANRKESFGTATVTYSNVTGTLSGPTTCTFSDGVAEFDLTGTGTADLQIVADGTATSVTGSVSCDCN